MHETSYCSHFGHEGAEKNYVQEVAHGVRHTQDCLCYGLHVWTNLKYDVTYKTYDVMLSIFNAVTEHGFFSVFPQYQFFLKNQRKDHNKKDPKTDQKFSILNLISRWQFGIQIQTLFTVFFLLRSLIFD